jgi:hypothetical protein
MLKIALDCRCPREIHSAHLRYGNCPDSPYASNNVYLTREGKPFIPVSGEFHYCRCDKAFWKEELLKMKAGGITVVSTYVFWLMHEEKPLDYNFEGNRDLKAFLGICKECGLAVILRMGPWCHGEMRKGGFPDWIDRMPGKRKDNADYLSKVKRLFQRYYQEVRDYLDGETIIGIQLENEYTGKAGHLHTLKKLASEAGFRVPYFTVTAWPPADTGYEFLPLYGEYPAEPWANTRRKLSPSFQFAIPQESNLHGKRDSERHRLKNRDYPYGTCETGCGIQATSHRREIISSDAAYATAFAAVATGANILGYYMFHGGTNPKGLYQESKRTGYPNDYPVMDYDFQAPIDRYGYPRESFLRLKNLNYFLNTFGESFAAMQPFCNPLPEKADDFSSPRCSVRINEKGEGYFFISSYERNHPTKDFEALNVELDTPQGKILLPSVNVKAGSMFFYPFNFFAGGILFDYILARPIAKVAYDGMTRYYFEEIDGVNARYCINGEKGFLPVRKTAVMSFGTGKDKTEIYLLSHKDANDFYLVNNKVYFTSAVVIGGDNPQIVYRNGDYLRTDGYEKTFGGCKEGDVRLLPGTPGFLPFKHYMFARGRSRYFHLKVPEDILSDCEDALLEFSFEGNSLQVFAGRSLINDTFNIDRKFVMSMKYYREDIKKYDFFVIRTKPFKRMKKPYTEFDAEYGNAMLRLGNVEIYKKEPL